MSVRGSSVVTGVPSAAGAGVGKLWRRGGRDLGDIPAPSTPFGCEAETPCKHWNLYKVKERKSQPPVHLSPHAADVIGRI